MQRQMTNLPRVKQQTTWLILNKEMKCSQLTQDNTEN